MLVRRVVDLDFDQLEKWCESRNQKMPHKSLFPRLGFIVDDIAAGFIYFTDSPVAIMDCYLSNPRSDQKMRGEAIDLITSALIKAAKFHRCSLVKCDTKLEVIKKRAIDFGFKNIGSHESFVLEI